FGGLEGRIRDELSGVTDLVDGAGRNIGETLAQRAAELERVSTEAQERISGTMDAGTSRLDERLSTMDRALSIGLDNVTRTIEGKAAGLAASLREAVSAAAQDMDGEAMRSAEILTRAGSEFTEELSTRNAEFTHSIEERSNEIVNRISETQNRLAGQAATVAQAFSEAANAIVNKVAEADSLVKKQVTAISEALSEAEQALQARGGSLHGTLSETASELHAATE